MPTHPGRPCSHRGCPNLVHGQGVRYCDEHPALHQRDKDIGRETAAERGYGATWREIRKRFLAHHLVCEVTPGCTGRATTVHHVIKRSDGGTDDESNLQASCHSCHSRLHGKRGDSFHSHGVGRQNL